MIQNQTIHDLTKLKPFRRRPKKSTQFHAIIHERSTIQAMPLQTFSRVVWETEHWAKTRLTTVPHLKLHNLSFARDQYWYLYQKNQNNGPTCMAFQSCKNSTASSIMGLQSPFCQGHNESGLSYGTLRKQGLAGNFIFGISACPAVCFATACT